MKRVEAELNRKILLARQNLESTPKQLRNAKTPVEQAFAGWKVRRSETELGYLLHLAAEDS
jgi:hypothetical protein